MKTLHIAFAALLGVTTLSNAGVVLSESFEGTVDFYDGGKNGGAFPAGNAGEWTARDSGYVNFTDVSATVSGQTGSQAAILDNNGNSWHGMGGFFSVGALTSGTLTLSMDLVNVGTNSDWKIAMIGFDQAALDAGQISFDNTKDQDAPWLGSTAGEYDVLLSVQTLAGTDYRNDAAPAFVSYSTSPINIATTNVTQYDYIAISIYADTDSNTTTLFQAVDNIELSHVVPEPGSYALLAGLLGLTSVMLRRRRC